MNEDQRLLAAWAAGDRSAGTKLFRRHYDSIGRFFRTKVGDDCEDLIQATFLGCVENIESFRAEASFRAYLFGIARNKLLRYLRDQKRDGQRFDPRTVSVAASVRSLTSVIAVKRLGEKLLAALQNLSVDTQTIMELHYWEGMRLCEIAEILEMPANTVRSHLRRGRIRLARELERDRTMVEASEGSREPDGHAAIADGHRGSELNSS